MAENQSYFIDEDTTDEFMDLPVPAYAEPTRGEMKDAPLPVPDLPPLTDH